MELIEAVMWHSAIIRGAVSQSTQDYYYRRHPATGTTSGALAVLMRHFGQQYDIAAITPLDLARFRMWLLTEPINRRKPGHPLAPATCNTYLKGVRSFFRRLHRYGLIDLDPAEDLMLIPRPDPNPRTFTAAELRLLVEAAAANPIKLVAVRNTAMVWSLAETGCRAHGLTTMQMEHLDRERWTATVWEKSKGGRRARPVFWSSEIGRTALLRWLEIRPVPAATVFYAVCNTHQDRYLPHCVRCQQRWGQPLTPNGLGQIIRRLCKRAGIPSRGPHAIRHSVGKELIRSGMSLGAVSQILGHRDPALTVLYYGRLESDELGELHSRHIWIE